MHLDNKHKMQRRVEEKVNVGHLHLAEKTDPAKIMNAIHTFFENHVF